MINQVSSVKKRLISYLKKRQPEIKDKDLPYLLNDIQRFVKVVQKIYIEPQAQISFKDISMGNEKIKHRIINTDFIEFLKVADKNKQKQPLKELFKKFNKAVTKKKI